MKKIGLIIFIAALVIGVVISNIFSFGSFSDFALKSPINFSIGSKVKGSGNVTTEQRDVDKFKNVNVSGIFKVEIVAQKNFNVQVEADDNLLPLIETKVKNGTLEIDTNKRFSSRNQIIVRVAAPNIEKLDVSGVTQTSLSNLDNDQLFLDLSGASAITVEGKTNQLEIDMSGASRVNAENLNAVEVSVDGSGASRATVNAGENLSSDLSGASQVKYKGSPKNIRKKTSGAGCLKQL